jgi:hypothetical protein
VSIFFNPDLVKVMRFVQFSKHFVAMEFICCTPTPLRSPGAHIHPVCAEFVRARPGFKQDLAADSIDLFLHRKIDRNQARLTPRPRLSRGEPFPYGTVPGSSWDSATTLYAFFPARAAWPHTSPSHSGIAENYYFFSAFPVKSCLQVA